MISKLKTLKNCGAHISGKKQSLLTLGKQQLATLVLCTSMVFVSVANAKDDYNELHQEIEILGSVLKTVFDQNAENSANTQQNVLRVRSMESRYLAGQGVVFTLSTGTSSSRWPMLNMPSGIDIPLPPEPSTSFFFDEYTGAVTLSEAPEIESLFDELSDELDELRETKNALRDQSWAQRSVARELESLKFELQKANKERQKEIQEKLKLLEEQNANAAKEKEKHKALATRIQEELQAKKTEKIAAIKQSKSAFLSEFEKTIADSLCRFAGAIKTLPSDEHVSFVLSDFDAQLTKDKQDRIYVFLMSDIKKCSQDKIKVSKLLSNAKSYDF